jgi:hypothetical protein
MRLNEKGHGPSTEDIAWTPKHIGDDRLDARAHFRHETKTVTVFCKFPV